MEIKKLHNFKRKCSVRLDSEDDGILSFDGGIFKLNNVSYDIIIMLEDHKTETDIVTQLASKYKVSPSIVAEDVGEFISVLREINLL